MAKKNELIGYQPSPDDFPLASLTTSEVYEDLEMGRGCHPGVVTWICIFEDTIKDPIMIPSDKDYWNADKDERKEEDTNRLITALQHNISYWLDDDSIMESGDCEHEHIEYMIGQGCSEGELNKMGTDGNDGIRGYWSITRD